MSREIEEISNHLASQQVESEKRYLLHLKKQHRELTALIITTIAMGQAGYMILKDVLESFPSTKMSKNMRERGRSSLHQALKSLKLEKGCLADFDTMQEEFTSSAVITPEEQAQIATDMLINYHEIAELCSLYMNAFSANPNIMNILRPILLAQSKYDTNGITPDTIKKYKQL